MCSGRPFSLAVFVLSFRVGTVTNSEVLEFGALCSAECWPRSTTSEGVSTSLLDSSRIFKTRKFIASSASGTHTTHGKK